MAKKIRRKSGENERPSLFFLLALIAGLILFIWMFVRSADRKPDPAPPADSSASAPILAG